MKKIIIIYILIFGGILNAQDSENSAATSFVSRLRATAKDSSITLTWENASSVAADLLVYQYTKTITGENITSALLLDTLSSDTESYKYSPKDLKEYFFTVQYALPSGEPNKLFIQYRNYTTKGVKSETLATEEEQAAEITEISAIIGTDSISVNFKVTEKDRDLMIFRSTSPILKKEDLLNANSPTALEAGTTSYTDYPIPGLDYYYAVLDAGLVKIGTIELEKGKNTMIKPAIIPLQADDSANQPHYSQKSLPLPLLALNRGIESGKALINSATIMLPEKQVITRITREALDKLMKNITLPLEEEKKIEILGIDKVENTIGEEYTLQQIINNDILTNNFTEGKEKLEDFMRIKHDKDVEARGHFYLGQAHYFLGNYQTAFMEFLLASEMYYYESQSWIDACFSKLTP